MKAIRSKQDVVLVAVLFASIFGFAYLVLFVSGWWLLSAPIYGLVALFFAIWISTGKIPKATKEDGITIPTRLLTVGGELKACTVILRPERIIVRASGSYTDIPMEAMTTIMFEDKTTDGLPMAGFGIDFDDSGSSARVMFFNEGVFSVRRTRKIVTAIQTSHQVWRQVHDGDMLSMIDVSAIKNSAVHRLP